MADPPAALSCQQARALLDRALVASDGLIWTGHARTRSHQRQFDVFDVRRVLAAGVIAPGQWDVRYRDWTYAVAGVDLDGDPLTVVVAFDEGSGTVTVITAYGD